MRVAVVALALAMALPLPSLAGAVKVQPGETLSEIADRLGVSVQRLIELNNIQDPDHVEAGTQLKVPGGATVAKASASGTVTVGAGETLSDIADRHGIPVTTLVALNSLSNPNHVEVGQVLRVKGGGRPASAAKSTPAAASYAYTPGASDHVVRKGESLSAIARGYGLSLSQLVALNAISDPNAVQAGTTLRLKGGAAATPVSPSTPRPAQARTQPRPAGERRPQPATSVAAAPRPAAAPVQQAASGKSDWRTYGPLQVDWTSWQPMGGSMVAATINTKGETLYTAINCGARKINSTSSSGQWGTWNDPASEVETKLVNDYCARRAS